MSQKIAAIILTGFVGGILLRSFVDFGPALAGFFVVLGLVFLFLCFIFHDSRFMILISIFLISAGLGILRYELKDIKNTELSEGRASIEGVISDEPDERENYTKLILYANNSKILLYTNHYPEYRYGDKIKVTGVLKKPQNIDSSFDWISYLAKDDVYYEMIYPKIELVSSGHGAWIKRQLFALKENFINKLGGIIPEPNSSFMAGLTVGARKSIPQGLLNDFRNTGIIHIVVLSGYNITLVADFVMKIFSFLPNYFGMGLGALAIILFAIMTGAGAATVRASIMALLVVLARATNRIYQITWALFVVGFLMVFYNPKILRFDTGFQLSFLATLALIYLAPYFTEKFSFITQKFKLREIISSTCATQVFVLPLLLYKTGIFSFVSLPVNLLILPFIPITMFFGFTTFLLKIPFGWIGYALTQYELFIVKIFAGLPFAAKTISNFPLFLMLIIYIIYAVLIYAKIYKKR